MGSRAKKLTGMRFGLLTVLSKHEVDKHGETKWLCICDCGNEHIATSYNLTHGKTTRCRQCSLKIIGEKNRTHGREPVRLYRAYSNMRTRCYNPKYEMFAHYGGKGIRVCEEWLGKEGFVRFREWALNNGYADKLTLDRIDNNKGYSPENCRWVDMEAQQNNRTNNRMLTVNGITDTMANWARRSGIKYCVIQSRLEKGQSAEEALGMKGEQFESAGCEKNS